MKYIIILITLVSLVSCKCAKTDTENTSETNSITETTIEPTEVMGIDGTFYVTSLYGKSMPNSGATIKMSSKSNTISGSSSCNDYTGTSVMSQGQVRITDVVATEMFCDGKMETQRSFFRAMGEARTYDNIRNGIQFKNANGEEVMIISSRLNE